MKVLMVFSNPAVGGTETFALALVPLLRKQNVDARIANLWADSKLEYFAKAKKLPFYSFDTHSRKITFKSILQLIKLLKKEKFDIVYVFGLRINLIYRLILPWVPSSLLLSGVRNEDNWRKWYHIVLDKYTQRYVDFTICNSKKLLEIKNKREKTPLNKLTVIPNGIDLDYFSMDAKAWPSRDDLNLPEGIIFTTVANIRHTKGHDFYLDAIDVALKNGLPSNVYFLWIGAGPLEEGLKEKINKLNLNDKIIWAGKIKDVRPYLANSNAFVLSSKEEGMPRAMMEAMAMGLPALCTDVGGNSEIIQSNSNGLIVPYKDIDKMAASLIQLSSAKWLNKEKSQLARQTIVKEFSLNRMVDEHLELFKKLSK